MTSSSSSSGHDSSFVGEERGNNLEVSVAGARLKVEIHAQFARASTGRALHGGHFRGVVQGVEQLVVRRIFLMTLSAVKNIVTPGDSFQGKSLIV